MCYLLGIDAGTTSMKGILIDGNGKEICRASANYSLVALDKFRQEIDPEKYWDAFTRIVKSILMESGVPSEAIKAVCTDSQGETLICLDKNGNPLRDAIVWLDNRSYMEAEKIRSDFDIQEIYNITGQPEVAATWPATKIMWLRKNEPDVFRETAKYLLVEDYLNYKLMGEYVSDRPLVSSTLYYDINRNEWWPKMLDYIGISSRQLPDVKMSGVQIGYLTRQASMETGLDINTIIVSGALDQIAGTIGAGNVSMNTITESTGTALAMCANVKTKPPYDKAVIIPCHSNAMGEYCLVFWSQTAGVILEWFRDSFYIGESGYKAIDRDAGKIPPGSDGLVLLPHFSGSAVPHFNPDAKGVFFGMELGHTRAHFARSIMESVAFMLKEHIETAERLGQEITEIRSLGGGAKSTLWNQIKADITGKEIVTLENSETASLGAAMMAGIGANVFSDFNDACRKCVKVKDRYSPNIENAQVYEKAFRKYKDLYQKLFGTQPGTQPGAPLGMQP